jgi:EAL domain-containing protein (putative c-di-GMP-specific phosphodiesterase class I)
MSDPDLSQRIHSLSLKIDNFSNLAQNDVQKNAALDAAACLRALSRCVESNAPVFGIEPWHKVQDKVPMSAPGEMLLRLKDEAGQLLPPYPAIMAFYDHGMTADIDTILVLCAINQFSADGEAQVSINVSGRSLRDAEFIKSVLPKIEALDLPKPRKIIFEIHESAVDKAMSQRVLGLCRKLGIGFALDDIGLSMNDIFRLSEFEQIADFVKLDRQFLNQAPGSKNSLDHILALINATLPSAALIAEGVQDAAHALELRKRYPLIQYVQGIYLPDRETFVRQWAELKLKSETVA